MNKRKSPEYKINKVCEYCGNQFKARTKTARFCKEVHYANCMICGKQFIVTNKQLIANSDWNTLVCGSQCAHKKVVNSKYIKNNGNYMSEKTIQQMKDTNIKKYGGIGFASTELYSKYINTMKEKYNEDNIKNLQTEIHNKIKQTNLEKYGSVSPFGNEEVREKSRATNMERYGNEYYAQSKEGKERNSKRMKKLYKEGLLDKIKLSNNNKYNVDYTLQLPEVRKKIYKTKKIRYDDEFWCNTEKANKTKYEKYGSANYNNRALCAKTNLERYGVPYTCQLPQVIDKNGHMISKINLKFAELLKNENINYSFEYRLNNMSYDIYLPDYNTVIELDPTYTHQSTGNRYFGKGKLPPLDMMYHINKSKNANNFNMECIHIFDWDNLDKIINRFTPKHIVYARNLIIKEVSKLDTDKFLNLYHIQNTCTNQKVRIGLYKDGELIEIMTFGMPRYNKKYEWELLRLCTHKDYNVVGGAEKLFKYFIKNYNVMSIISYCDVSKFTGDVYKKLGFKLLKFNKPSLHWCKSKTQHITDNLLRQRGYDQLFGTNYGKGTSNEELMLNNGWLGIYDCGQKTYLWEV